MFNKAIVSVIAIAAYASGSASALSINDSCTKRVKLSSKGGKYADMTMDGKVLDMELVKVHSDTRPSSKNYGIVDDNMNKVFVIDGLRATFNVEYVCSEKETRVQKPDKKQKHETKQPKTNDKICTKRVKLSSKNYRYTDMALPGKVLDMELVKVHSKIKPTKYNNIMGLYYGIVYENENKVYITDGLRATFDVKYVC